MTKISVIHLVYIIDNLPTAESAQMSLLSVARALFIQKKLIVGSDSVAVDVSTVNSKFVGLVHCPVSSCNVSLKPAHTIKKNKVYWSMGTVNRHLETHHHL